MNAKQFSLSSITVKTIIVHTVSYFVMGLLAFVFLNYARLFADPNFKNFMRQTNDPLVAAGPLFQLIRGLLFGLVFYSLRKAFFVPRNGWLKMWLVLVVIGIFSTFGPAPGSLEGMVYTTIPLRLQLTGLPEGVIQALLLSFMLYYWVNHPEKKWLTWTLGTIFVIVLLFSILGVLMGNQL